jgi:hypothetical protein
MSVQVEKRLFVNRLGFPRFQYLDGEFFDRSFGAEYGALKNRTFRKSDLNVGAPRGNFGKVQAKVSGGFHRKVYPLRSEIFQVKVAVPIASGRRGRGIHFVFRNPLSRHGRAGYGLTRFIEDLTGKSLFGLKGEIGGSGTVAGKIVDDLRGDSITRRSDGQVKGSVGKRRGNEVTSGIGLDGDLTPERYLSLGIHGVDQDMGTGKRLSLGITDRAGECRA